jgi:hypothetical protein
MIALGVCILALAACYWAGRRSLGQGLIALLAAGYFYGIARANLQTAYSHFIFDAGLLGLYISQKWTSEDPSEAKRLKTVQMWTVLLIAWPVLMSMLPFQPILVSLVGLRGSALFLPLLLLASRLKASDVRQLSIGLAVLNLIAVGFAGAEYWLGLPRFYPYSSVTQLIYSSGDVEGGFFRIPAIFTNAHSYGGTMVASIPYLIGGWEQALTRKLRVLAVLGIVAALLGVLLSATRLNFVTGVAMILAAVMSGRMKAGRWVAFVALIGIMGWVAMTNQRFQRFKSLSDADTVTDRIAGSVNRGFFEILLEYPMGNGLGGGGTSIPYFLEGQVRNPIGMENEYARILSEQGIIGLLLWLGFVAWYLSRARVAFAKGPWTTGRRLVWCLSAFGLGTAWIGTGFLTAIPGTALMMLGMGWTSAPMRDAFERQRPVRIPGFHAGRGALKVVSHS